MRRTYSSSPAGAQPSLTPRAASPGQPQLGYRDAHYALVFLAFLLLNAPVSPLTAPIMAPSSFAIGVLGSVCALLGLGIAIVARRSLAGNWSGSVTFKQDHTLVTTGIYGYMRHPIYRGVLLMFTGTALLVGTLGAVAGFLIMFLTFGSSSSKKKPS